MVVLVEPLPPSKVVVVLVAQACAALLHASRQLVNAPPALPLHFVSLTTVQVVLVSFLFRLLQAANPARPQMELLRAAFTVVCEFCAARYVVDEAELRVLLTENYPKLRANSASIAAWPLGFKNRVPVPQKDGCRMMGASSARQPSPVQRNHRSRSWSKT